VFRGSTAESGLPPLSFALAQTRPARAGGRIALPTTPLPPLTLLLGGARSGKSAHGEALVLASGLRPVYLATAQALDAEMAERIHRHREARAAVWLTVEEPLRLPETLAEHARADRAVLVDCLTLWLTNLMVAGRDPAEASDRLLATLAAPAGPVVLVSNEVGLGVVPQGAMSRAFVDHAGRLHQRIGAVADRVRFLAAGLPLDLKTPAAGASSCTF
jgi:adenosylcobinamide kinase / adenosylcobinamide-phosphate guanylyltransferase